jgi:hypothetical protein
LTFWRSSETRFGVKLMLFLHNLRTVYSLDRPNFDYVSISVEPVSHQVAPVACHALLFFQLLLFFLLMIKSFLHVTWLFNVPLPILLFVSLLPTADLDVSYTSLD